MIHMLGCSRYYGGKHKLLVVTVMGNDNLLEGRRKQFALRDFNKFEIYVL